MSSTPNGLKIRIYNIIVHKNKLINYEYGKFVDEHISEHKETTLQRWMFLSKLIVHYRILKRTTPLYYQYDEKDGLFGNPFYYKNSFIRKTPEEVVNLLKEYDVISFDVFDTLVYRKVEQPKDVFSIMSAEMGFNDFASVRKKAEGLARGANEKRTGSREITLEEIYTVLECDFGIDKKWQRRECEIELDLLEANPYMHKIYTELLKVGKTIVIMSDMYLSSDVIKKILEKNGFSGYVKLYLSNEYGLRKGDGGLQKVLLKDYPEKKIIHVGDNLEADIEKSKKVGLDAFYNPSAINVYKEPDMDNLGGSFYRAIINTYLNNGLWEKNIHYEHGFRTGGILTVGFCQYINEVAKRKNIEKVLFCARDCNIIYKVYNDLYKEYPNEYIEISRYSLMNITTDRYLYDFVNRFLLRYVKQSGTTKTIKDIFEESGLGYLTDYLEEADIEKYLFPSNISKGKIEEFMFDHKDIIKEHNKSHVLAARKYFSEIIGEAQNILIVDIGWSGTCITGLKYFLEQQFPVKGLHISGVLMCTSRGEALTSSISQGEIDSYICSPFKNMDNTRFIMPGNTSVHDILHMPVEFMFTSTESSLMNYCEDKDGNIVFERMDNKPSNVNEILEIQKGIRDFSKIYKEHTQAYEKLFRVSPYVAFAPLKNAISNRSYCRKVYGDFTYDAMTAPLCDDRRSVTYNSLFNDAEEFVLAHNNTDTSKKRILFVTPELIYTGAPRSLLRMCKIAISLGYEAVVWSAKPGPFISEYEKNNIDVSIVPENKLRNREIINRMKSFDMAICNTIVTDKYARNASFYIPTVWYIREATNIPDFIRKDEFREYTLKHSKDIYCVSEYAADAIGRFTKNKIRVVHNSVEDETDLATGYVPGSGDKVKFVQFGTLEYRKGYDVLLSAYLAMPEDYKEKAELYFAGGFISSGTSYCSYLFSKMQGVKNVHYLGIVKGEEDKIRTLSNMDVVVVASRDESCSLVALEGAMLSKPVILTENTGAKYIVSKGSGCIVKADDVESLKSAMMKLIDNKKELSKIGKISRQNYEMYASMTSYIKDMEEMFSLTKLKGKPFFKLRRCINRIENHELIRLASQKATKYAHEIKRKRKANVIVSLTSFPGRMDIVCQCINSLLEQSVKPRKIVLWLSELQFPNKEKNLPAELLHLEKSSLFEIKWVKDDLAPHKKYFYAMREFPNIPVIIVDDDAVYSKYLVEQLMESYKKFPHCISCMRANLMMFREDGSLRCYNSWLMEYRGLLDIPSYQLMPTGVGGVLYPPNSIPKEALDANTIKKTCLYTDDLWLKMFAVSNGYKTVIPRNYTTYKEIMEARANALSRKNVIQNNNDVAMQKIVNYFKESGQNDILTIIRKDRYF